VNDLKGDAPFLVRRTLMLLVAGWTLVMLLASAPALAQQPPSQDPPPPSATSTEDAAPQPPSGGDDSWPRPRGGIETGAGGTAPRDSADLPLFPTTVGGLVLAGAVITFRHRSRNRRGPGAR
jgi:hypothetical protein